MKIYGYILAAITLFFFSIHGVGIRFLELDIGINPGLITFIRYFGGVIFLMALLPFFSSKKDISKIFFDKKQHILHDKIFWVTGVFLFLTLLTFHFGLKFTSASNSVLIQTLFPVMVAIMVLFFHGKKKSGLDMRKVFFIVVFASIGSSLLISDSSFITEGLDEDEKIMGDIFAFISMVFLAVFNFFNVELRRKYNNYNGLLITILFLGMGLIFSLPFLLLGFEQLFQLEGKALIFVFLISVGSTGIAYFSLFFAARYLNVITIALLYNSMGITTVIFEYYFYGNSTSPFTWKLMLGAIIIVSSAAYVNYLNSKSEK